MSILERPGLSASDRGPWTSHPLHGPSWATGLL